MSRAAYPMTRKGLAQTLRRALRDRRSTSRGARAWAEGMIAGYRACRLLRVAEHELVDVREWPNR